MSTITTTTITTTITSSTISNKISATSKSTTSIAINTITTSTTADTSTTTTATMTATMTTNETTTTSATTTETMSRKPGIILDEILSLKPNESFSDLLFSGAFIEQDKEQKTPTPPSLQVTKFMLIIGDESNSTILTQKREEVTTEEILSLRQNETFSDLLFSNIPNEKSLKTVSNGDGVHIEQAINLLGNFPSGQQQQISESVTDSETSSDSSLPRIGRSRKVEIRPNKLDSSREELFSSVPTNMKKFSANGKFETENGRIISHRLKTGLSLSP